MPRVNPAQVVSTPPCPPSWSRASWSRASPTRGLPKGGVGRGGPMGSHRASRLQPSGTLAPGPEKPGAKTVPTVPTVPKGRFWLRIATTSATAPMVLVVPRAWPGDPRPAICWCDPWLGPGPGTTTGPPGNSPQQPAPRFAGCSRPCRGPAPRNHPCHRPFPGLPPSMGPRPAGVPFAGYGTQV